MMEFIVKIKYKQIYKGKVYTFNCKNLLTLSNDEKSFSGDFQYSESHSDESYSSRFRGEDVGRAK